MTRRGIPLLELKIACLVIVILLAIVAQEAWHGFQRKQDQSCLRNLVGMTTASLSPGTTCPVSDEPYAATVTGERIAFECPSAEPHLPTRPRFVFDGAEWGVEQTFPAAPKEPDLAAEWNRRATVEAVDGGVKLSVGRSTAGTWVGLPLAGLFTLICVGLVLGAIGVATKEVLEERKRKGKLSLEPYKEMSGLIVGSVFWLAFTGYGFWLQIDTLDAELRPGAATLDGETVGASAVVAIRSGDEQRVILLDLARPDADHVLFTTEAERLGGVAALHDAVSGRVR